MDALGGFLDYWRCQIGRNGRIRGVMRDRDDENMSTTRNLNVVCGGLRWDDLTLWQRHIALCTNGNDEMFSTQLPERENGSAIKKKTPTQGLDWIGRTSIHPL